MSADREKSDSRRATDLAVQLGVPVRLYKRVIERHYAEVERKARLVGAFDDTEKEELVGRYTNVLLLLSSLQFAAGAVLDTERKASKMQALVLESRMREMEKEFERVKVFFDVQRESRIYG